jgi:hypothetical protein
MLKFETKNYLTFYNVIMKMSFEPGVVDFCHHTISEYGADPAPLRGLMKFLCKPIKEISDIDDINVALHDLYK